MALVCHSLDIKNACSFQTLISLTTVVRPAYCHLKSEVAALQLMLSCCVLVCRAILHQGYIKLQLHAIALINIEQRYKRNKQL